MDTNEVLLTVLTVAIVILIVVVVAVLVLVMQVLGKVKKASAEIEMLTEKGVEAAERMAPFSAATVGVLQVAKILFKRR